MACGIFELDIQSLADVSRASAMPQMEKTSPNETNLMVLLYYLPAQLMHTASGQKISHEGP